MTIKTKRNSNKNFGYFFFIFFFILAFLPLLKDENINKWFLLVSFIFLFLVKINSSILSYLNKIWIKFAILLGKIMNPIIMSFIFFAIVTPIGILMKMLKKDILGLKKNKKESYWINKKNLKNKMKNQF